MNRSRKIRGVTRFSTVGPDDFQSPSVVKDRRVHLRLKLNHPLLVFSSW
jgi:hypothetical protein